MNVARLAKGSVLGVCAIVLAVLCGSVSPALALSPWWHLNSGAIPSVLHPGLAKDEVQEILAAEGSAFNLTVNGVEVGLFESSPYPFEGAVTQATHENVQTALEAPNIYGAGNVVVTGGPAGVAPLTVTSPDRLVVPIKVGGFQYPSPGSVETKVLSQGRPYDGRIVLTASNLGDANVDGSVTPVRITDTLPAGLKAVSIEGTSGEGVYERGPVNCPTEKEVKEGAPLTCTFAGTQPPYHPIEVTIGVDVESAPTVDNRVSVSGGGAPSVSVKRPVAVAGEPAFGVEAYELTHEEEGGALDTQAGSHPFQQTTTITLNQTFEAVPNAPTEPQRLRPRPVVLTKDLHFKWPPGLVGNPNAVPRCSLGQFLSSVSASESGFNEDVSACPSQTAIGVARVLLNEPLRIGVADYIVPLFNIEPSVGEPVRAGFRILKTPVLIDSSIRTGSDYGATVSVDNITQTIGFLSSQVTLWGVPGDPRHDTARGYGCLAESSGLSHLLPCNLAGQVHPPPFLVLPPSCGGTFATSVEVDSWAAPGVFGSPFPSSELLPGLDGCNRLPFSPQVRVSPDSQAGSTPSGLTVDVHVPQDLALNSTGLAEGVVKDIAVTLPEGLQLNPAAGDGLQACSEAQIGFTGFAELDKLGEPGVQTAQFSPDEPSCPNASKIGNVTIKTPLLANPLTGFVYLASPQNFSGAPQENPFGSLVAMYIVARDPISGVLVKLPGKVSLSETGQISTTFDNNPQLPFEDAELEFFGGDRAPLATPSLCRRAGEAGYVTLASFTPWSSSEAAPSTSEFNIASGPNGSPCSNPPGNQSPTTLPFAPSLTAQTTSIQAGGFSPFTMTMSREDGNQDLQAISLHMPPGLSGLLSSVKLCGEAQANAGTCGPESQIGETTVSVGLGGDPFSVTGGKVFITEKYAGAPYGLSIVNPAKAGPFDLGKVVVRAKIEVDPITAALTITSDNTGPYKIPTILDGIPLQIKHVNVTINRPGFTFNPTNCNPMKITGSLSSTQGATSALSVPFQITNCAVLGFKPKFTASTSGKTSRANGASLHVKLVYPKAPFGSQANIRSVKVDLPRALPSRLKTLQKACLAATFNANPASCPAASIVGHAKAITPLIPVPLTGPAYFVSHGGEAFPQLVVVLQGYGVTVHLVGDTFISKAGITSSTFRTVPDVPVGTFELTLPQGKYSALAANGNLCKLKLAMPTAFVAQNGAVIHQSTPISVTGCPKKKAKAKAKKK